jgi:hypothetical protein
MSFRAICPHCGRKYDLADRLEGKTVACKECQARFVAESIDDEAVTAAAPKSKAPTRASRAADDEDDRPTRARPKAVDEDDDVDDEETEPSGGIRGIHWAIGGIGVGIVVMTVVLVFLLRGGSDEPIAQNNVVPPQGEQPIPPPMPPVQPPVVQPPIVQPNPNPFPKVEPKPVVPNPVPKQEGPKPFNPNPLPNPFEKVAPAVVEWKAEPDPSPTKFDVKVNPKAFQPLIGSPDAVFPTTPSKYMLVKHGQFNKQGAQVFDLTNLQAVATLPLPGTFESNHGTLSPDGKYWMKYAPHKSGQPFPKGKVLQVIDMKAANVLPEFTTWNSSEKYHDFLSEAQGIAISRDFKTSKAEIWNLATGQLVRQYELKMQSFHDAMFALSPGRKYIACCNSDDFIIQIMLAETGDLVGQLVFKEEDDDKNTPFRSTEGVGLAFSEDGEELAAAVKIGDRFRLITWKMATGDVGVEHYLHAGADSIFRNFFNRNDAGRNLSWLPDRSGWLINGKSILEYMSGRAIFQFQDPIGQEPSRRFISKNAMAAVTKGVGNGQLTVVAVPKDLYAAMDKAKKANQVTMALPAAKEIDLTATPRPASDVWKGEADAPPSTAKAIGLAPIPLAIPFQQLLDLDLASATTAQGVMLYSVPIDPLSAVQIVKADRFDATSGKPLGSMDLFQTDRLPRRDSALPTFGFNRDEAKVRVALSPDGTRLAVRFAKTPQRIDVWDTTTKKHVSGWKSADAKPMRWAQFADGKKLWVAVDKTLVLWDVDEGKAVAAVDDAIAGAAVFSPGSKLIAIPTTTGVVVHDAKTGDARGRLEAAPDAMMGKSGVAFSPDGKEIAAASPSNIARWNLATGKFSAMQTYTDTPGAGGFVPGVHMFGKPPVDAAVPEFKFLGPKFFYVNHQIYDWAAKQPIWQYDLLVGNVIKPQSAPDARLWIARSGNFKAPGSLMAITLPDVQAQGLSNLLAGGGAQPIFGPGTPIQIQGGDDTIRKAWEQRLTSRGFKIAPGGLNLSLSQSEGKSTNAEYVISEGGRGMFGPPPSMFKNPGGNEKTVNITQRTINCTLTLTDPAGGQVYTRQHPITTSDRISFQGENLQGALDQQVNQGAQSVLANMDFPKQVYRIQGQYHVLPKRSTLLQP